jgi:excisionase family DNA binding protein
MDTSDCRQRGAAHKEGEVERLSVRPATAARMLSISRSAVYEMLSRGQIRSCTCGSARLIPVTELVRWLESAA